MTRRMLVAVALIALLLVAGCTGATDDSAADDVAVSSDAYATEDNSGTADDTDAAETDSAVSAGGMQVLMMGRSVMAGWFQYWGWDWDGPVERNGFTLTYGELASPPSIASSACEYIRSAPAGSVVFFKFCFVDFYGGEGSEGEAQLADMEGWVEEVADCASERGVTLIIGNALPQVEEYTDAALISQYRAYNSWLEEYAAQQGDSVCVLNLYGTLSASGGWLRPEFAIGNHDAHLNDDAYDSLDPLLFDLLAEVTR